VSGGITEIGKTVEEPAPPPGPEGRLARAFVLAAILLVAATLRLGGLGRTSLWFDEVVTMRLARTESAAEMIALLGRIDATRAPLHPLLLRPWVRLFGPSDVSGRAFSALCGVLTVALVYRIGTLAFDPRTGLWASWLCAISPLLVYYSREARMYAWLVLATCVAWCLLFSFRRSASWRTRVLYALSLIALAYSHPLGVFMVAALALASLAHRRAFRLSRKGWLATHGAVLAAVAPWVGRYLDHAPEGPSGVTSLRFLLGMPIGFIGGNFVVLLACVGLIVFGLFRKVPGRGVALDDPVAASCLVLWLTLPPGALYVYSLVWHPLFGPARYTLFVGPAYLLLVARGISRLPRWSALGVGAAVLLLSARMLASTVYPSDLKADWRSAAAYLDRRDPGAPVVVASADPPNTAEVETARYYLGADRRVLAMPARGDWPETDSGPFWVAVGLRSGRPARDFPEKLGSAGRTQEVIDVPGLRLTRYAERM
jgi:4-amino-4-deoxy-L-arabinose transferase-like glycosyltransferase